VELENLLDRAAERQRRRSKGQLARGCQPACASPPERGGVRQPPAHPLKGGGCGNGDNRRPWALMSGSPCATSLSLRASSLSGQGWLRQPLAQLAESPASPCSGGCDNAQLHVCSLVQPHYYRTTRRLPWVRASGRVSLFVSRTFHDAAKGYRTAPAGLCAVRHRVFAPASPRFPTSPPDPNRRRVTNDSNTHARRRRLLHAHAATAASIVGRASDLSNLHPTSDRYNLYTSCLLGSVV
jgi:hypothetical protein